jgi:hypothetical protein
VPLLVAGYFGTSINSSSIEYSTDEANRTIDSGTVADAHAASTERLTCQVEQEAKQCGFDIVIEDAPAEDAPAEESIDEQLVSAHSAHAKNGARTCEPRFLGWSDIRPGGSSGSTREATTA